MNENMKTLTNASERVVRYEKEKSPVFTQFLCVWICLCTGFRGWSDSMIVTIDNIRTTLFQMYYIRVEPRIRRIDS